MRWARMAVPDESRGTFNRGILDLSSDEPDRFRQAWGLSEAARRRAQIEEATGVRLRVRHAAGVSAWA